MLTQKTPCHHLSGSNLCSRWPPDRLQRLRPESFTLQRKITWTSKLTSWNLAGMKDSEIICKIICLFIIFSASQQQMIFNRWPPHQETERFVEFVSGRHDLIYGKQGICVSVYSESKYVYKQWLCAWICACACLENDQTTAWCLVLAQSASVLQKQENENVSVVLLNCIYWVIYVHRFSAHGAAVRAPTRGAHAAVHNCDSWGQSTKGETNTKEKEKKIKSPAKQIFPWEFITLFASQMVSLTCQIPGWTPRRKRGRNPFTYITRSWTFNPIRNFYHYVL